MTEIKQLLQATDDESSQRILEWFKGSRQLTETNATDFINVMKESGLVVRMTKPSGRVKEVTVHSSNLSQVNKSPDENPAKGYGMWKPEFEDLLYSGRYAIQLVPYTESYFSQTDIDSQAMGSDKV